MSLTLELPVERVDEEYLAQVRYSLTFAAEEIETYELGPDGVLRLALRPGSDIAAVRAKVEQILERFAKAEFGMKNVVHFEQHREASRCDDVWAQLIERRWISPVGTGHVVLRGPAAALQRTIDSKVTGTFASHFAAEEETYPNTILCQTLDRIHHFTSFPEHIDFVSHLRSDVSVLRQFSENCREGGWRSELHNGRMGAVRFAMTPSCCYHCYEGMEGWNLTKPGRCVTAVVGCHRYEGGNLSAMSRLRAFTMREVIWIGHPEYVKSCRAEADRMIVEWAKDWELDCSVENANDMFFTDEYAVKASFQRQQEAKRELRLLVPQEARRIAVFSSNFHSNTFGKAFNISVDGRPATSACIGWGYERWIYAIFSQFGLDVAGWPRGLQEDFRRFSGTGG